MENEEVKKDTTENNIENKENNDNNIEQTEETSTIEETKTEEVSSNETKIEESTSNDSNIENDDSSDTTIEDTKSDVPVSETKEDQQVNEEPKYEVVEPVYEEVKIKQKEVRTDSYFDGSLLELIGWRLLAGLLTGVTLGIAYPWAMCMLYNYQFKHTVYNGKRLKFEGTGGDLFVNIFKWVFFTIITLGIYLFFVPIRRTKWVISNLHFEDEPYNKDESYFDGNTLQLIGVNILCNILNLISLGLLYPFTVCYKLKWINKHAIINRKRLIFKGKSLNLFGKYLLWIFLTIITFGIFGLWLGIKELKWETKNTSIRLAGEKEVKDTLAYILMIPILLAGIGLVIGLFSYGAGIIANIGSDIFSGDFDFGTLFDSEKRKDYFESSKYCDAGWKYEEHYSLCSKHDVTEAECKEANGYFYLNICEKPTNDSDETIEEMGKRKNAIISQDLDNETKGETPSTNSGNTKVPAKQETKTETSKDTNPVNQPSKQVPASNANNDYIDLSKNVKYAQNAQAFECSGCFTDAFINKIKSAKGYYVTKGNRNQLEYTQVVDLSSPYNSTKYYGTDYTKEIWATGASNIGGGGGEGLPLTKDVCTKHHLNCK